MAKVQTVGKWAGSGLYGRLAGTGATLILAFALFRSVEAVSQAASTSPPPTLQDTGLYTNFAALQINPEHLAFAPQYPLWSDGATKRRWISLPPGTAIDGSDPDTWIFPIGTRFWKEFSFDGQRVETRYMRLQADGQWLYAAYAWSPDDRGAQLVSARGKRGAYPLQGGRPHMIPGVSDCKACHQGVRTEVLGFSTLQLSPERDPGALHGELRPYPGVDLRYLVDKGFLIGLPKTLLDAPPRIMATSTAQRATLGYMHGNCGHCHNQQGSLQNIGLFLRYVVGTKDQPALTSTIGQPIKKLAPGQSPNAGLRIVPRRPDQSGLVQRVASRYPALQMPPLGTELVDQEAVQLLHRWVVEIDQPIRGFDQDENGGNQ